MSAEEFLRAMGEKTNTALEVHLGTWREAPAALVEAISYSLLGNGKRLRPALALGAAEAVSGDDSKAIPVACAIEMIHTYSLIHDDLPSMDNDDLRRGKPTSHKVYGEAMAILAGDGLMAMAFAVLAETNNVQVIREVAQAAGVHGMVGGQVIDLQSEGKRIGLDALREMHRRKTGALLRVSVRAGALLAGATPSQLDALTAYGDHLGLAFQIADDVLDVAGDAELMGKPVGSDEAHQKSTYPALIGVDESRRMARESADAAVAALAAFGDEAGDLRALARYVVERRR